MINRRTHCFFGTATLLSAFHSFFSPSVPPKVAHVNVTSRTTSSLTLSWDGQLDRGWTYSWKINGTPHPSTPRYSSVNFTIKNLDPGTKYLFSVTREFGGLSSEPFEDFTVTSVSYTVKRKHLLAPIQKHSCLFQFSKAFHGMIPVVFLPTAINCASGIWDVTSSSIQGEVKGLFTRAKATNGSQEFETDNRNNLSFTGLYPGATYQIVLIYQEGSRDWEQCRQSVTICK